MKDANDATIGFYEVSKDKRPKILMQMTLTAWYFLRQA